MAPKEIVNQLIKEMVRPAFKRAGFEIDRTTFRKAEKDFVKVFQIQHSNFNSTVAARFYLNAGLFFPASYGVRWRSFYGEDLPVPQKVKMEHCQFGFRVDELTKHNQAYVVEKQTDPEQFEKAVRTDIEASISWFAAIKNLNDCLSASRQIYPGRAACDFDVALTYAEQGNRLRATEIASAHRGEADGEKQWSASMLAEARKRGIQV